MKITYPVIYDYVLRKKASITNHFTPLKSRVKRGYRESIRMHPSPPHEINKAIGAIEINRNCNLRCAMCNTHLSRRENIVMDMEVFKRCVEEMDILNQQIVSLHTIGEPLLNPHLREYLDYLEKHGKFIYLQTNGLLFKKNVECIERYHKIIDTLGFSIDGATKETYEKIRCGGNFEELIKNMDVFKELNSRKPFKHVFIESVVTRDNVNELAFFLNFFKDYIPMERIRLHLLNGASPDNTYFFKNCILNNHIQLNANSESHSNTREIHNNGDVSLGGRDYHGDLVIGNIKNSTLSEIEQHLDEIRDGRLGNRLCSSYYELNPVVSALWENFIRILIIHNSRQFNEEKIQNRINRFFELFASGIPSEEEYVSLFY